MNDDGFTSLPGCPRLPKTDPRFEALGSLDELSAALGLLRAVLPADPRAARLESIQRDLLAIGAELATGHPQFPAEAVLLLERAAAALSAGLPPLHGFLLPGTNEPSARAHWARAVCRRAEREFLRAGEAGAAAGFPAARQYLNRLSGFLFSLARALEA
jgi:cob(I)alamin adenosyltransferase